MKLCVYGAGAVGGALAVRLKSAGEDVTVVARGAHGDAIRERGLTLVAGETTRTARLHCVGDPGALQAVPDVVFVTVKQTHLPAIAQPLARLQSGGARIVLAMNGIPWWYADELPISRKAAFVDGLDPGRVLRSALDTEALIGGVVQSSNEVVAPGVVMATTPARNRLILGNVASGADNRIGEIVAVLRRADYDAWETADIRREIWNKMALWLAVSPIAALTGLPLDRLASDPGGFAVMSAVMREANVLGRKLGFELADDAEERIGFYRDKPTRPSLLKDFELGREPELASGVLVFDAIAQALEVPAPHIATIAALARLKFAAIREPGA
jgi:2-dehydropantoate 2-reductase